jgi:hypothetical protein
LVATGKTKKDKDATRQKLQPKLNKTSLLLPKNQLLNKPNKLKQNSTRYLFLEFGKDDKGGVDKKDD